MSTSSRGSRYADSCFVQFKSMELSLPLSAQREAFVIKTMAIEIRRIVCKPFVLLKGPAQSHIQMLCLPHSLYRFISEVSLIVVSQATPFYQEADSSHYLKRRCQSPLCEPNNPFLTLGQDVLFIKTSSLGESACRYK